MRTRRVRVSYSVYLTCEVCRDLVIWWVDEEKPTKCVNCRDKDAAAAEHAARRRDRRHSKDKE